MSLARYAKRRDISEPAIIEALTQAGWHVWQLDRPCDLLCWKPVLGLGTFKTLEVKTGRGKKLVVACDKRQIAQQTFIQTTGTPIVRTPLEALRAVGAITPSNFEDL